MSDLPPNTEAIFLRFLEEVVQAPANGREPLFHVDELTSVALRPQERVRFANLCRQHVNNPETGELISALIRQLASNLDGVWHDAESWISLIERAGFPAGLAVFGAAVVRIIGFGVASTANVILGPLAFLGYGILTLFTCAGGFLWFRKRSRTLKSKADALRLLATLIQDRFTNVS